MLFHFHYARRPSFQKIFALADVKTMRNVEVVERICSKQKTAGRSLLSILNTCVTSGGARMLRSNLLQPSADVDLINARLDAVEELLANNAVRSD